MASKDPVEFSKLLALKMGQRLREVVRPYIESKALRDSIEVVLQVEGTSIGAAMRWPHYWAVYYHDGRGPLRPKNGRFLVWFVDPEDDPRFETGYPVKREDIKRLELTPEEFKAALESGKMIVRSYAGPAKGKRFLDRLQGRAAKKVDAIALRETRGHVKAALADVLKLRISSSLS